MCMHVIYYCVKRWDFYKVVLLYCTDFLQTMSSKSVVLWMSLVNFVSQIPPCTPPSQQDNMLHRRKSLVPRQKEPLPISVSSRLVPELLAGNAALLTLTSKNSGWLTPITSVLKQCSYWINLTMKCSLFSAFMRLTIKMLLQHEDITFDVVLQTNNFNK